MAVVTPTQAAELLPVRLQDIEETIRDFDLAVQRDARGHVTGIEDKALRKLLEARGFRLEQPSINDRLNSLAAAIRQLSEGKWSIRFSAMAATAAFGAASLSAWSIWNDETVLSARTSYEVRSAITDRLAAANSAIARRDAARAALGATTSDEERAAAEREIELEGRYAEVHARDLDARVGLLAGLRQAGVIEDAEWASALTDICGNLVPADYYGRRDLFASTVAVCAKAQEDGDWSP